MDLKKQQFKNQSQPHLTFPITVNSFSLNILKLKKALLIIDMVFPLLVLRERDI